MTDQTRKQVLCHPLLKKGGAHHQTKKTARRRVKHQIESALDEWFATQTAPKKGSTPGDGSADYYIH